MSALRESPQRSAEISIHKAPGSDRDPVIMRDTAFSHSPCSCRKTTAELPWTGPVHMTPSHNGPRKYENMSRHAALPEGETAHIPTGASNRKAVRDRIDHAGKCNENSCPVSLCSLLCKLLRKTSHSLFFFPISKFLFCQCVHIPECRKSYKKARPGL